MEVTLIPTPLQIHEWIQEAAHDAILQICLQNQIGPAELHQIAHQLAQREAVADGNTSRRENERLYTRTEGSHSEPLC